MGSPLYAHVGDDPVDLEWAARWVGEDYKNRPLTSTVLVLILLFFPDGGLVDDQISPRITPIQADRRDPRLWNLERAQSAPWASQLSENLERGHRFLWLFS